MNLLRSDKRAGIMDWRTEDGQFSGVLVNVPVSRERGEKGAELPAAALLAVPKDKPSESPSINKYSPVIARGYSPEELGPLVSTWADQNSGKSLWELRRVV